jgi:hypothetical protein
MKDYYRHLDTTVSIFPYLESMLIDTIASSMLGTIVTVYNKNIIYQKHYPLQSRM